jgi:hypothetical protein
MVYVILIVIVGCVLWASRHASRVAPVPAPLEVRAPRPRVAQGRVAQGRVAQQPGLTEDDLIAFGLALEAEADVVSVLLLEGVGPAGGRAPSVPVPRARPGTSSPAAGAA